MGPTGPTAKLLLLGSTLLTWAWPQAAHGADYYVSSTRPARSDGNAGTDPESPWETFDKVKAEWSSLAPGDTVHLDRGSTWPITVSSDYWEIEHGGSSAGSLTLRGDDYGSGAAPVLERVGGTGSLAFLLIEASHVTVRDFVLDGGHADHGEATAGIVVGANGGAVSHVDVLNMTISDLGGDASTYNCGIWVVSWSGDPITDCLIQGNHVSDYGAHGLNHYSPHTLARITWRDNVVVNQHPGRFADANSALQIMTGNEDNVFEHNYLEDQTTTDAAIFVFSKYHDDVDANQIRHNVVAHSGSTGILYSFDHTGQRVLGDIYGNIVYGSKRVGIGVYPHDHYGAGSRINIYNNTVYDNLTDGGSDYYSGEIVLDDLAVNTTINLFNNLIVRPTGGARFGLSVADGFDGTFDHSNNLYWHEDGADAAIVQYQGSHSVAEVLGFEPSAQNTDPLLADLALPPTSVSTAAGAEPDGFRPTAASPAIDQGLDLGGPYDTGIDGTARPHGPAWDIGAYEWSLPGAGGGGASGTGGGAAGGSGGAGGQATGGSPTPVGGAVDESSGCGCRTAGRRSTGAHWVVLLAGLGLLRRRR